MSKSNDYSKLVIPYNLNSTNFKLEKRVGVKKWEEKGIGRMYNPVIEAGRGVVVANWGTTGVEWVMKTSKYIVFKTANSIYRVSVAK